MVIHPRVSLLLWLSGVRCNEWSKPYKHAQQVLPVGNGQCQVMAWPEHTCGDRVHPEECSGAPHLPGCNTLCPFYLAASLSDVKRADIPLWQADPKLHRKDYDKAFPPWGSLICNGQFYHVHNTHPSGGDEVQDPASGQRPSLKDHCKMIKKHQFKITRPSLQQHRQQSLWFRLCFTDFPTGRFSCPSNTVCHTNRQSHLGLGRGG